MRHAIVIEQAAGNFSAYVSDLLGCVVTGGTAREAEQKLREAIAFHLEGFREDGVAIPPPLSRVEYVDIAVAVCSAGRAPRTVSGSPIYREEANLAPFATSRADRQVFPQMDCG